MYHLELRQFPHNVCRFNLQERELLVLAVPWANEEWVEVGERKWNTNQAKLTILEGPQLSMPQLAMGRGWRNAQRQCEDVTERVLETLKRADGASAGRATGQEAAGQAAGAAAEPAVGVATPPVAGSELELLADSLALEILQRLDDAPAPLSIAWRLAAARMPERSAGEALLLAERAVSSLLARGLIVLQLTGPRGSAGAGEREQAGEGILEPDGDRDGDGPWPGQEQIERALRAVESWAEGEQSGALLMRRA